MFCAQVFNGDFCLNNANFGELSTKDLRSESDTGIWKPVFEARQIEPEFEYVMVDSTLVRAHACAFAMEKNGNQKHALRRRKEDFSTNNPCLV